MVCAQCHHAGCDGAIDISGELETKTSFWGKYIELLLVGHMELRLTPHGDVYR